MTAAGSTTYAWDAANRLKNVNGGSLGSYGYDGNGKRVKKTESGTTTYYVISSVLGSAMEVTSAGVQRAYVMNGSSVVAQLNPNGNFYWLHLDHLGSGRKMTDSSGNMTYRAEFDPYGKLLYEWSSPTNLNTKKFTGYERDAATNLDYAQARMYSSDWGRFMSPDPKGFASANKKSPLTLNRYSYAGGNPANFVDRAGTDFWYWDFWNPFLSNNGFDFPHYFGYFLDRALAALSDQITANLAALANASKEPPKEKAKACRTEVRARKLDLDLIPITGTKVPGYHSYIVLVDFDPETMSETNRRYFGGWKNENKNPAQIDAIANHYDYYWAGKDVEINPSVEEATTTSGSCDLVFSSFVITANQITKADIEYKALSVNSNSAVYTALKTAGLNADFYGNSIMKQLGPLGSTLLSGWGTLLSNYY